MTVYDPDTTWQRVEDEPEDKVPVPSTEEQ